MANTTLYQYGLVQFKIFPLNIHEFDHSTSSSWAKKDIVESIPHREWTGEDDEEIRFRGRVFPYRIGGMTSLDALDNYRRAGYPHVLVRGGAGADEGRPLGWFVIDRLIRKHDHLGADGYGRVINFEATFFRVDIAPEPELYYSQIQDLTRG
jgi:phage tail protein